jgi:hypothetical protein
VAGRKAAGRGGQNDIVAQPASLRPALAMQLETNHSLIASATRSVTLGVLLLTSTLACGGLGPRAEAQNTAPAMVEFLPGPGDQQPELSPDGNTEDLVSAGSEASPVDAAVGEGGGNAPLAARWLVLPERAAVDFDQWLDRVRATEPGVEHLYYAYYDAAEDRPWFLSTMISAEVLRYSLQRGQLDEAVAIGDALLAWQHLGEGPAGERLSGAFPSEIERTDVGRWRARYLYDSSDNMAVLQGLMELYETTGSPRHLRAARRVGGWLRDVMAHGERFGVWVDPLGAPMRAVTESGDFDNRISVGRTLFWLPALERLSALSGDQTFAELAFHTRALLLQGQLANGGFADHYDPGYPAQVFSLENFKSYGNNGSVVADDSIRAAIAAKRAGDAVAASRFIGWLDAERGRVAGYLSLESGAAEFPEGNREYYDVISSALYRELVDAQETSEALEFVAGVQDGNGGWFWGQDAESGSQVDSNQSTLTGLWALVDLSPVPRDTLSRAY